MSDTAPGRDPTAPTDSASDDGGLTDLARSADRLYRAMRRARAATVNKATTLSTSQVALLEPILDFSRTGRVGVSVGELALAAEISVPTATRMLSQLEAKAVISRQADDQDGRRVLVQLTTGGQAMLEAARGEQRARQLSSLTAYTVDERRKLAHELRRLAAIIDQARIDADKVGVDYEEAAKNSEVDRTGPGRSHCA